MTRALRWAAISAAAAVVTGLGCGDGRPTAPADPIPGMLTVSLAPSASEPGAVLVLVRGPGIGDPTPANPGFQLFTRPAGEADAYHVAVIGISVSGPLFSFAVPDVQSRDAYSVELVEVADQANMVVADRDGYRLSVLRSSDVELPEVSSR